ncbi:MAG: ABC transporter permease [Candidatus Thiosymbion ectosymbiont of Robbea hypermnestra]|nr:ABC transporter permease [Candidatus Thiosymbion ectosymbiont of Robbea hypermnestra]
MVHIKDTLLQAIELLYLLVLKELKVRYKRSFFGYLWAIANPLAFAFIYWLAFKFIMRIEMENYSIFILTAMFPWAWLSQSVTQGTGSYTNNVSLVRRVRLPKVILPLSNVIQEMVHFIFAIPVVFLFVFLTGGEGNPIMQTWQIGLMLFLQVLFVFPLTVIGAVLNVYVRDIQYVVGILFSMLFFATPIVYPLSMVPVQYQVYFRSNPIYWLIESWRTVFAGEVLPAQYVFNLLLWIVVFSLFAIWIYRRLSSKIAELV